MCGIQREADKKKQVLSNEYKFDIFETVYFSVIDTTTLKVENWDMREARSQMSPCTGVHPRTTLFSHGLKKRRRYRQRQLIIITSNITMKRRMPTHSY